MTSRTLSAILALCFALAFFLPIESGRAAETRVDCDKVMHRARERQIGAGSCERFGYFAIDCFQLRERQGRCGASGRAFRGAPHAGSLDCDITCTFAAVAVR